MRVLDRRQQLTQIALHLRRCAGGAIMKVARGVLVLTRPAQRLDRQLWAEPRVHVVPAGDEHHLAWGAELAHLAHVVPDHGRNASTAIAEHQLEELSAISPG